MRTPGTLIRTLSLLAAAGAAVYFWSAALSGRTAVELLRGGNQATVAALVVAPKPAPQASHAAAPAPRPTPARRRPLRQPPAITRLEPVPQAIADAIDYVETTGSVPTATIDPYRALIVTRPPAGPVETPVPAPTGAVPATAEEISPEPAIVVPAGIGGSAEIGVKPSTPKALPATAPEPETPAGVTAPSADAPDPPNGSARAGTTSPAATPRPTPLGRQTTPQPAAPTPTPAPTAPAPATTEPQTTPSTTPSGTSTTPPPTVLGLNNPVTPTPTPATPSDGRHTDAADPAHDRRPDTAHAPDDRRPDAADAAHDRRPDAADAAHDRHADAADAAERLTRLRVRAVLPAPLVEGDRARDRRVQRLGAADRDPRLGVALELVRQALALGADEEGRLAAQVDLRRVARRRARRARRACPGTTANGTSGTRQIDPAEARSALGPVGSAQPSDSATAAPNASAVRISVPTLPGSARRQSASVTGRASAAGRSSRR